ncbi:hypothetical protein PHAVU_010G072500 [Phaseolus vulgaris]|uniref:EF-hand domain-containing protein n=1 Tax=Phaseolus vulgaris TaxID=3885 RepID=V7ARA2_PHAVU|nr:hypothetical protein PHAVU_010G072500g [Phaseolus vulgaris]XP_007134748.1 hypothetical protein PHAVU_010G072500g [Phaseolus vulgaris]ESW06741.1 hypothetical protein PHAVU_010G072500g [Phaseolus vulgaris]ESW06742.1 hypothetical protein PHAVU_010G072500g [Phaseolus vulgaris]
MGKYGAAERNRPNAKRMATPRPHDGGGTESKEQAKITEQSEMAKRGTSDSESEDASISGSESEEAQTMDNGKKGVTEYEKQRLSRMAENRARLEALGLPQMALSLKSSHLHIAKKGKEKKAEEDDDEEYVPENEGGPDSSSSSEHEEDRKDEDFATKKSSGSRKRKVKNKGLKKKAEVSGKMDASNSKYIDYYDDDEALRQAIALSLQNSAEGSYLPDQNVLNINKIEEKGNNQTQEDKGRKKNKKSFASRLQLTEDELIVHFFQLDEAGKGTINVRDLQRAATAHDFLWEDKELVDMIRCFDSDGDGKLSLDDFRKITIRCNMIKES